MRPALILACAAMMTANGCATVKYYRGKAARVDAPAASSAPAQDAGRAVADAPNPPPGMQYLYGSGEAGAISIQAFRGLLDYVSTRLEIRPKESAILEEGSTLVSPRFTSCGSRPYAVVFDVDETLLLNLGFEYADARTGRGYDDALWDRWEKTGVTKVEAVPGAVYAVNTLRRYGVTVVFNTNRAAANADATAAALNLAGLGMAIHGETLFLKGDDAMGSRKDGRRQTIADRYCVIALAGDQLGDFSDLFNQIEPVPERRRAALTGEIGKMWGNGWFMLPNPVYGTALKGGYDDVFPMDKRWEPSGRNVPDGK